MRFIFPLALVAVSTFAVSQRAPRETVSAQNLVPDEMPQPIGVTAAIEMNARFVDARLPDADNLPFPSGGRGRRVAVGDANDARKIGAQFFVPTQTLWRTTPLSFAAPKMEIAPREVWKNRAKFRIIDVREVEEFKASHIPTSSRHSMFADFSRETKPVALFCLTGHRSAALVQKLHARGVRNVFSVRGGWLDWKEQSLPLSTVEFDRTAEAT